ncbi:MAG: MBL fold metallo-hydrolase [Actinomycetota bacterium]|nr:MBL fold metallo-hydrolase [Actinomycetota bacterium]
MSLWNEVGDRVHQRRYGSIDVSVCVVRGNDGLLVVDTRSSHREADEIRDDLSEFGAASVRWVMNTHAHFDHCFGNYRFGPHSDIGAPIYGHELMPKHLDDYERPLLAEWIKNGAGGGAEEWLVESVGTPESLREIVITPTNELVAERALLDLGDRGVEILYLGLGHTDNDLLLHVPDSEAWLVGDLLEESGPPVYGWGSFPLDWPQTIASLCERVTAGATLVPGHGTPVGPALPSPSSESSTASLPSSASFTAAAYPRSRPSARAEIAGPIHLRCSRWPSRKATGSSVDSPWWDAAKRSLEASDSLTLEPMGVGPCRA